MSRMGGFKEAYLRHRRNEFLNHKLYTHFFTKHKPQEYISCGLHYFVGLLFNHITISKNCTDCFGILDFSSFFYVAQLLKDVYYYKQELVVLFWKAGFFRHKSWLTDALVCIFLHRLTRHHLDAACPFSGFWQDRHLLLRRKRQLLCEVKVKTRYHQSCSPSPR